MLRSGKTLLKKTVTAVGIDLTPVTNAVCVQQTRSIRPRKPAFSGIAKTKLFRIPKQAEHPPDELAEIRRISNQYRLYVRSISNYFKLENQSHAAGSKEAEIGTELEEAEWQESLLRITQWNKEVAVERNERLQEENKAKEDEIRQTILEEERQQQLRLQEIEAIVKREKELSKSYITPDNIDKAIEEALENKIDYNYAIDVQGKKYIGRFVDASGTEDLPEAGESDEDSLPPLFQSSPISADFSSRK